MHADIAVLPGDGIGPEVTAAAVTVLRTLARRHGHSFDFHEYDIGGIAIDRHGEPLPQATLQGCQQANAVLLGAVGGPKWSDPNAKVRPEQGLLALRKGLGLFANLRPVRPHPAALNASPIKPHLLTGVDIVVVRELTGGIYFGEKTRDAHGASDLCSYSVTEIERVVRSAFRLARQRRSYLVSVDKANVLETSQLWRDVVIEVAKDYPDVALTHMYVDNAAMQLVKAPKKFDVVVTGNMFGDILSDEASMLTGSIGMLPSASLNSKNQGLYEPSHGSAPDIAGQGIANPLATILSAAMMLRFSLNQEAAAVQIENAVKKVLQQGLRTPDIYSQGCTKVTTAQMGEAVVRAL